MFKSKLEVDRHVNNCLKKINNETERNLRCFSFGKLYFTVGDYEQAHKYVTSYLSVKRKSAEGYLLLGKSLEKLGKIDAALEAYRNCLQIDPKQNNLVIKVCELLSSDNVELDLSGARYFCDLAQSFDPNNPAVYSLKEKLITKENENPVKITELLLKELETRPSDINLRIRLLKHFMQNNMVVDAYKHASAIEEKHIDVFYKNLSWYENFAEILLRFQRDHSSEAINSWDFWLLSVSVLERLVALSLEEYDNNFKLSTEYVMALFNFDQILYKAQQNINNISTDRSLTSIFFQHYQAQLYFHFSTIILKQIKKEHMELKESSNFVLSVLFTAYHFNPPDLNSLWLIQSSENIKRLVQRWYQVACYRNSQVGHVLLAAAKDRKSLLLEKATQYSTGMWRENLYKKLFVRRDQQLKMTSSFFVTNNESAQPTIKLPNTDDLQRYDEIAQSAYPDSLHHYIWVAFNSKISEVNIRTFDGLQYSNANLMNCAAESLNLLDIYGFVYCATLCANSHLKESKNIFFNLLPASITENLATTNETKFFETAYKMYKNDQSFHSSDLRVLLIRGIEVIRCVGHHGLDAKLLVMLANIFEERSKKLTQQSEIDSTLARAELYWKTAVPLLDKIKNSEAITYLNNRMFEFKYNKLTQTEAKTFLEKGKLFIATQLFKKRDIDRAFAIFNELKDPYASFYQYQIYKIMADQEKTKNDSSDAQTEYKIFLSKARDCLYLTLDRLREPSYDLTHPLNSSLSTEIGKIENLLSESESCKLDFNKSDSSTEENFSLNISNRDNYLLNTSTNLSLNGNKSVLHDSHSTPLRFNVQRQEVRPSPERLDAQIRQIMTSKEANFILVSEQNKTIIETQKSLLERLNFVINDIKTIKCDVEKLKEMMKSIDEIKNTTQDFQNIIDAVQEIKKDLNEIKKNDNKNNQLSEEDLYVLDPDYGVDYNMAANIPPNLHGSYSNYPAGRIPNINHLPAYGPSLMYPGIYPNLSYPYGGINFAQPGPLSFLLDQQGSNVSGAPPSLSAGLPPALPASLPSSLPSSLSSSLPAPLPASLPASLPAPLLTSLPPNHVSATAQASTKFGFDIRKNPVSSQNLSQLNQPEVSVASSNISHIKFPAASSPIVPTFGKYAPVNVVITTSDPLPNKNVLISQPVLSVTIPPQHMKGNLNKNNTVTSASSVASSLFTSTTVSDLSFTNQDKNVDKTRDVSSSSINSLESEEPNIDFKPLIPLPDEVPVVTGEENETEMFCARAKLFRHVNINGNKEWKERGVGNLKILNNQETGKFRILMRRDQVLKLCANHFIQKDMNMVPTVTNEKAFTWIAQDFSEGELQVETFCVKFKTIEDAKKFSEVFKSVKDIMQSQVQDKEVEKNKPVFAEKVKESPNLFQSIGNNNSTSLGGFVFTGTPTFKPKEIIPAITPEQPKETPKNSPFSTFVFGKNIKKDEETKIFSPLVICQEKKTDEADVSSEEEFVPTAEFKPVIPLPELVQIKTGEENSEVLFEARTKLFRYDSNGENKEWKERGVGTIKILKDDFLRLLMRRDQVHKVCCNHRVLKDMIFKANSSNPKAIVWRAKDFSEGELVPETFTARFKTEETASQFLKTLQDMQKCMDENNSFIKNEETKLERPNQNKNFSININKPSTDVGFGNAFKAKPGSWECKSCLIRNEPGNSICVACGTSVDGTQKQTGTNSSTSFTFNFTPNSSNPVNEVKPGIGFGDAFKIKPGTWECNACLIRNEVNAQKCVACDTPRDSTMNQTVEKGQGNFTFNFGTNNVKQANEGKKEVGFGDAFKAKPGTWECKSCLIRNEATVQNCVACNTPKDGALKQTAAPDKTAGDSKWIFGIQSTAITSNQNQDIKTTLGQSIFSTAKPIFSNSTFFFGPNQKEETKINNEEKSNDGKSDIGETKWNFGMKSSTNASTPTNKSSLEKVNLDISNKSDSFVFGSNQKEGFEFKQRTPRRISSGPGNEESDGSYVEEEEDTIYFKPIIPLPDKIQVTTGEEDEDVLFSHRAKLYRFVSGEWKERGIGDVKILRNRITKKLRVIMRREQVLKICLNHILTKEIEYLPKDERSLRFVAADYSEGEIDYKQFCLRFKNDEIKKDFQKAVGAALEENINKTSNESVSETEDDDEVQIVSETKVTPEEEQIALRLGLPPKFLSYKQLPDCACEQCKKDDEYLKDLFATEPQPNLKSPAKNSFTFTTTTSLPTSTSNIFGSFSLKPPVLATTSTLSKSNDDVAANFTFASSAVNPPNLFTSNPIGNTFSSNTSIFGNSTNSNFSFSNNSNQVPPFTTANLFSSSFGQKSDEGTQNKFTFEKKPFETIFGGSSVITQQNLPPPKNMFSSFSSNSIQGEDSTITSKLQETEEPILKCDTTLSFASLAAKEKNEVKPAFSKNKDGTFSFLGAGTPVFGSLKANTKRGDTSQNTDDEENHNDDYDPHYEPIVPLPDQIVVTTGEENENVLFNERAKLFRYDADSKEWKERGIGQLKILQHREKNTFRLLLRREQVFKVVLNQLINSNLDLQPMLTSDKAWMWAGYNYTDEGNCLEKLAVRFKNVELANQFRDVIKDVIVKSQITIKEKQEVPLFVQNFELDTLRTDESNDSYYEEEGEEDEEDEEERTVMFMKECTLSEQQSENQWRSVGEGELQVYYDPELYAARIQVSDNDGKILSNTLIGINTLMDLTENECTWKAAEWAISDDVQWRTLKATFVTEHEAQELYSNYLESLNYAQQVGLIDEIPNEYEPED